jgi:hypothetical protein
VDTFSGHPLPVALVVAIVRVLGSLRSFASRGIGTGKNSFFLALGFLATGWMLSLSSLKI